MDNWARINQNFSSYTPCIWQGWNTRKAFEIQKINAANNTVRWKTDQTRIEQTGSIWFMYILLYNGNCQRNSLGKLLINLSHKSVSFLLGHNSPYIHACTYVRTTYNASKSAKVKAGWLAGWLSLESIQRAGLSQYLAIESAYFPVGHIDQLSTLEFRWLSKILLIGFLALLHCIKYERFQLFFLPNKLSL